VQYGQGQAVGVVTDAPPRGEQLPAERGSDDGRPLQDRRQDLPQRPLVDAQDAADRDVGQDGDGADREGYPDRLRQICIDGTLDVVNGDPQRDAMGNPVDQVGPGVRSRSERDAMGNPVDQVGPGVRSRGERDAMGNPIDSDGPMKGRAGRRFRGSRRAAT